MLSPMLTFSPWANILHTQKAHPGISWRRCGTVRLFFFFMAQPGMGPLSYCPSRSIPRRNWSHPTIKNADHGVHIPLALCVHPEAAPVWRWALRQIRGPDPGTGSPSAGFSRQEEIFANFSVCEIFSVHACQRPWRTRHNSVSVKPDG